MVRLQQKYQVEVAPALRAEFGYKNVNEVPKVTKVVINVGAGEAVSNVKCLDVIEEYITNISGQKPIQRKAKKSIAGFKLREGHPIGVMVTLRRDKMYEFLDRLITVSLPRVRDFKGISTKAFDGRGNYSLGIKEQLVFPEVEYDKIDKVRGMNITIVTTAKTDDEARSLLAGLGLPFRK
ncbi:MAG: 50S ribosomal protein L5 [Candidatus Lambdaproteobacteria bacterium RIFOXYD1_FULL_56_27]|uniref:Large ribosomal subunit protein uL5 n=1 Tax=Candidatus Lambdaproteobacteria bacterium RIFOXYD2_FULL_56_26 TaxID=1817773 RepID=A0A1F6GMU2_9PROT|nr:MAG: 50S ribosomal protein L5 [Candidatus Lambdaproteobacteria bacterium RIFOXYD2_FULL_56_26]OGH05632.1 MAG: 50S ribosomal protein L5 [Candidatus Lambdaproteobacteria bacterium RIFOXYC1_FULL_56_13]OGH08592.1 MAG: 50S ribosomal protein L5 [Candidatus Lambdaproteobacteria bacterium RIFOXYD1_FULL_56_27]